MLNLDWKPPRLETERLILRYLDERDAAMSSSMPAIQTSLATRFSTRTKHLTTRCSFFAITACHAMRTASPTRRHRVAKRPDVLRNWSDRLSLGFASRRCDGNGVRRPSPIGGGLIAEAGLAMINYVFQTFAVERLQWRCSDEKIPPAAAWPRKWGMKHEGTLRSCLNGKRQTPRRGHVLDAALGLGK